MEIFVSIISSLIVGLYTGVVVMRISSFNQYRIYATEVIFGVFSTDEPKESDFEPECVDVNENGEPIFENNGYRDAHIHYLTFGTINLGSYEKFLLISNIFKELGHNKASLLCHSIYENIDNAAWKIHETRTNTSPSEDNITPHDIHAQRPKWESSVLNITPDLWAIFKPFPNKKTAS